MRFKYRFTPLLLASTTLFAWTSGTGCGGDGSTSTSTGTGGAAATTELPCDVDAVLEANCRQCHGATPTFGAPTP